jgi:hypothetical protein
MIANVCLLRVILGVFLSFTAFESSPSEKLLET